MLLVSVLESFLVFVLELAIGKTGLFWKQVWGLFVGCSPPRPPRIFITFIRTSQFFNTKQNSLIPIQPSFPELHSNFVKHL